MIHEKTWEKLQKRMEELHIEENDLEESFVLSSKKGGQHVNKTSSCVYLKHLPSGIEVKCQESRSQADNRYYARKYLIEKLEEKILGKASPKQKKIEKMQKQKKKRAARSGKKYQNLGDTAEEKKIFSEKMQ